MLPNFSVVAFTVDLRSTTHSADLHVDCSVQSDLDFPPRISGEVCDFLSIPLNFTSWLPLFLLRKISLGSLVALIDMAIYSLIGLENGISIPWCMMILNMKPTIIHNLLSYFMLILSKP